MLENISKFVGVLSALASLVALGVSSYGALKPHNVVVSIDKDVVTAPPQLLSLGRWVQQYAPPVAKLLKASKPACQVPKELQEGLSRVPSVQEFDLYSRSDFGSVTIGITNNRNDNVKDGEATLQISGLTSFQGVTGNSNFMTMDRKLAEWNSVLLTDSPTQQNPINKVLLLPLPELKTGGFVRITVYGQNSGYADADIIGLTSAPAEKHYIVKTQTTTSTPKWVIALRLLFLFVSALLLIRSF